jgi:hypothetical protein
MNPEMQLLLDEATRRFDERFSAHESKVDQRFNDAQVSWNRKFDSVFIAQEGRVADLEKAAEAFSEWRPVIDHAVDVLKTEVKKVSQYWERAVADHTDKSTGVLPSLSSASPIGGVAAPPATAPSPVGAPATLPSGHRVNLTPRADGFGWVTTQIPPPANGMNHHPNPPPLTFPVPYRSPSSPPHSGSGLHSGTGRMPKLDFPYFDGDNPKHWITLCEDYFDLYGVESYRWIRIARMHLQGAAKRWYPSVESQVKHCSWSEFCQLVLDRFGREQHEILLRQLFTTPTRFR